MIAYAEAKKIAVILATIGEPTRLRILYRLALLPQNVSQLARAIGVSMVNISHHLGVMRNNGVLEDEKDGRRVVYRVHSSIFQSNSHNLDSDELGTLNLGAYRMVLLRSGRRKRSGK